jgi:hypothetical protein
VDVQRKLCTARTKSGATASSDLQWND